VAEAVATALDSNRAGSRFKRLGAGRPAGHSKSRGTMKRILGMGVGLVYFVIAFGAFSRARAGWADNYPDVGFWFTIIAAFLTIAGVSALVGTWIHTQESKG